MTNSEQVAHNSMLRDIECQSYGGDVHDDVQVHHWIDAKRESPIAAQMCWVAVPNVVTCRHQTLLCSMDTDDQWRDASGVLMFRKVSFWQYADVPECDIPC